MGALDGKIAIVTGGTSGIGEGIAKAFVSEGAKVVIVGRREEEGRALEKRLGVRFVRADVANEADVKAMVDRTLEWFGRLDCLVNNAGNSLSDDQHHRDRRGDHRSGPGGQRPWRDPGRPSTPRLPCCKTGSGSIINIGSVAGHRGGISAHVYTASKGAVSAFTRSAAAELGEKGIRVNTISPGAIVTGIFGKNAGLDGSKADQVAGVVKEAFATIQPIPRAGLPDDIAQAAVFLASDGVRVRQRPGYRDRWRADGVTRGWSCYGGGASRNGEAHQGGGCGAVDRRAARSPLALV